MLTQWVVMVLNCNVLCHLQQCKCPDQDLWTPLYTLGLMKSTSCTMHDTPYECMNMSYTLYEHTAVPSAKDIFQQCCVSATSTSMLCTVQLAASWASRIAPAALVVADCSCWLSLTMNAAVASLAAPLPALLRCVTFILYLCFCFAFNSPDIQKTGLRQVRSSKILRSSLASRTWLG